MIPISLEKFVSKYIERNPGENKKVIASIIKNAVKRKKSGAKCMQCHQTIWAIGSAIVGWDGCFSCITGESDDSNDYEINEVC